MPAVSFYLKEPKSEKETPIYLNFSFGRSKPFKFGVGDKVHPDNWSFDKQRFREKRGVLDYARRNEVLENIATEIKAIFFELTRLKVYLTAAVLREELNIKLNRVECKRDKTLMAFLDYIVDLKKKINSTDRYIVKMAADNIKKLAKSKGVVYNFEDINQSFALEMLAFLYKANYKQNSIHTCFSAMRIILLHAQEDGINPYNFFKSKKFAAKEEKVKKFSLSEQDLLKIHQLDLSAYKPVYSTARDIFLIGSFTAMRVSDYGSISEVNIQNNFIYRKTQKTGEYVIVPVHWVVSEVLARRGGKFPKPISPIVLNKYIKEICEIAEINNSVVVSYTRGGKRVDEVLEKFKTVTTQTARRSGATNMKKAGINDSSIMMLTGHQSYSSFKKYIDIEKEENATMLANHAFFKKPEKNTEDE